MMQYMCEPFIKQFTIICRTRRMELSTSQFRNLGNMQNEELRLARKPELQSISKCPLRMHLPNEVYSLPSVLSGRQKVQTLPGSSKIATRGTTIRDTQKLQNKVLTQQILSVPDLSLVLVQNVRQLCKKKLRYGLIYQEENEL